MKTSITILILLLASMLHAQSSFIVGTNAVPVIFEDAELSQTNRVLICNDLTRVFAFESNFSNLVAHFATPIGDATGYLKDIIDVNISLYNIVCGEDFSDLSQGKIDALVSSGTPLIWIMERGRVWTLPRGKPIDACPRTLEPQGFVLADS